MSPPHSYIYCLKKPEIKPGMNVKLEKEILINQKSNSGSAMKLKRLLADWIGRGD